MRDILHSVLIIEHTELGDNWSFWLKKALLAEYTEMIELKPEEKR